MAVERKTISDNEKVRTLLMKATRDYDFREKFLENPVELAKEYRVSLSENQIAKIHSIQQLVQDLDEIDCPLIPDPIFYPAVFRRWKTDIIIRAIQMSPSLWEGVLEALEKQGIIIPPRPNLYPSPELLGLKYRNMHRFF